MTEFISRVCYAEQCFEVTIRTDREAHYRETLDFARYLVDHRKPEGGKRCTKSDFNWLGKTVFLSEEEAKATLEERKNA